MAADEFSLIERYFSTIRYSRQPACLGQGDDAAILDIPDGQQLVCSVDTLIAGRHFPHQTPACDVAYKALAVNLSDLAAMAATPAWFLLSLTMPESDESWLDEFSASLRHQADKHQIELIGGDTCKGELSISIQIMGLVDKGKAVTRSGAEVGNLIVVSGVLGSACLGLSVIQENVELPDSQLDGVLQALNRPNPRLELRGFLQDYATSCIDCSDGLVGDLRHILKASKVGATLDMGQIPVHPWIESNRQYQMALTGGDDYELCFTIGSKDMDALERWNGDSTHCRLTVIGEITEHGYFLRQEGQQINLENFTAFQHFNTARNPSGEKDNVNG